MRIKVYKKDDGSVDVLVKRTRSSEAPSVLLRGVRGELPRQVLRETVDKIRENVPGPNLGRE